MKSQNPKCPEAHQLHDLLDGVAPETETALLTRHLDECGQCQQALETLAGDAEAWSALPHLKTQRDEPSLGRVLDELRSAPEVLSGDSHTHLSADEDPILRYLTASECTDSVGRFGPYEVLEVVGRGGMGVVLKALDAELDRVVALKVLAPELAAAGAARKRFAREARAAAAVNHEHVVPIFDVDAAAGLPYLVMPFVPGGSLQQRLDRHGPLALEEILQIGLQAAQGLAAAHAQGLVHRDVKPANILLETGVGLSAPPVKITDFGLARAMDDATLTQSGFLPGTPAYMAPEQARGDAIDHRADLFSLGSVLYAMCTGKPPFQASTTLALLRRVSEDQPVPVQELNPNVPDWLVTIMNRLHAKEPAHRYQSAGEVATVFADCLAHVREPRRVPLPTALRYARKPSTPRPRRRRFAWLAAAATILVTLTVTEVTGVTEIVDWAATILRIKTPEGTLVIEVSDPDIQVTVDGEDVAITGKGIAEIRVKAGKREVKAMKDGKAVVERIVEIKRDGKEVVKIGVEGAGITAVGDVKELQRLRDMLEHARQQERQARAEAERQRALADESLARALAERKRAEAGRKDAEKARQRAEDEALQARQQAERAAEAERAARAAAAHELQRTERSLYAAQLLRAQQAWEAGQLKAAKDLLEQMPARMRNWEWQYLRSLSDGAKEMTLPGHTGGVKSVAFSPDGKLLASTGKDETVKIWDAQTGKEIRLIRPPIKSTSHLAFSPDGRFVAVGGSDKVILLNLEEGSWVWQSFTKTLKPAAIAFSPDGKLIALTDSEGVSIADTATGKTVRQLGAKEESVALAFSPDGKVLVTAGGKQAFVHAWDVDTGKLRFNNSPSDSPVLSIAYSPDGSRLAASSQDGIVTLIDARTGKLIAQFKGHTGAALGAAFSPDGQRIVSTGADKTVRMWDVSSGQSVLILRNAGGPAGIAFSPDGKSIVTGGQGDGVRIWTVEPATPKKP